MAVAFVIWAPLGEVTGAFKFNKSAIGESS